MDTQSITLALSARWHTFPDRFQWIADHGFGLEYTPGPDALDRLPAHLDPILAAGVPVRYHGFFPGHEIGDPDPTRAGRALDLHLATLEAMQGRGEPVITVHVGLRHRDAVDPGRVVENLSRLVERAHALGITVCLENLRRGPTSDPDTVLAWAEAAGARITLDVGHATSCQRVLDGELAAVDFVDLFAHRLREVHFYERESDRHYPPRDMRLLGPVVDRLLETGCRWWTLELDDYDEALATRRLLLAHLAARERRS